MVTFPSIFIFVCHVVKSKDVGSANYSSKLFRYDFACSVICFIIIVYGFLLQRCEVLCYAKVHMFLFTSFCFLMGLQVTFFPFSNRVVVVLVVIFRLLLFGE